MINFFPLRVYSCYDFLNSNIKIEEYLVFLTENKIAKASLVNTNNLYKLQNFCSLAQAQNIQPIIGLTIAKVQIDSKTILETTFYPCNFKGYQNLISFSKTIVYDKAPYLDIDSLSSTLFCDLLVVFTVKKKTDVLAIRKKISSFPNSLSSFYYGVVDWKNSSLISFLTTDKSLQQQIVDFREIRYLTSAKKKSYQALLAIKNKMILTNISNDLDKGYFSEELVTQTSSIKTLIITNHNHFFKQIKLVFPKNSQLNLKKIAYPDQFSSAFAYLTNLCEKGLKKIKKINSINYQKRVEYELTVIKNKDLVDYFLLVSDYVAFAKKKDILIGPGRGSVSGSLVAFLLGITNIDPLLYNLIFERFLNPQQTKMPDIDIDIEDERRNEILSYLTTKYGHNHVAQIATFQRIASKMALRDIGRILEIDAKLIDQIAKTVSLADNENLEKAIKKSLFLQIQEKKLPLLFILAKTIVNLPRQVSVHAAGIVITETKITEVVSIWKDENSNTILQADMKDLEKLNFIKMDLLGLRNLTTISQVLEKVVKNQTKYQFLTTLSLDDADTFQTLSRGETEGIFQIESEHVTTLFQKIQPQTISDVALGISLFRPSAMQNIQTFLQNIGKSSEQIDYLDSSFQPILVSTFGIPIYQEQILHIVRIFSKISYSDAELLRNAFSKKELSKIEKWKEFFFMESKKTGRSKELIKKVWNMIVNFAKYGFNRSHAVAYAVIVYWMAYLKTHYLEQFMVFLLNQTINDQEKTEKYLFVLRKKGYQISPPQVNQAELFYQQMQKKIYLPFTSIKQFSPVLANKIVKVRKMNGFFQDPFDFFSKMLLEKYTPSVFTKLINSGCLDEWNYNRATLLTNLSKFILTADFVNIKSEFKSNWNLLVEKPSLKLVADSPTQILQAELENFNFFLSYHLLASFVAQTKKKLSYQAWPNLSVAEAIVGVSQSFFYLSAIVQSIFPIFTKTKKRMAFLMLSDDSGAVKVIVWPKLWTQLTTLQTGEMILALISCKTPKNIANSITVFHKFDFVLEKILQR